MAAVVVLLLVVVFLYVYAGAAARREHAFGRHRTHREEPGDYYASYPGWPAPPPSIVPRAGRPGRPHAPVWRWCPCPGEPELSCRCPVA